MNRTTFRILDGAPSGRRRGGLLLALLAGILLAVSPLGAASSMDKANEACLACHGDKDMVKDGPNGTTVPLFVDADRFGKAVHTSLAAVYASIGVDLVPPSADLDDLPVLIQRVADSIKGWEGGSLPDLSQPPSAAAQGATTTPTAG